MAIGMFSWLTIVRFVGGAVYGYACVKIGALLARRIAENKYSELTEAQSENFRKHLRAELRLHEEAEKRAYVDGVISGFFAGAGIMRRAAKGQNTKYTPELKAALKKARKLANDDNEPECKS